MTAHILNPPQLAKRIVYVFFPTAGTTRISGPDSRNLILNYTRGSLNVRVNGVSFTEGYEYSATDGAGLDFAAAFTGGERVEVEKLGTFAIPQSYSKEEADNRFFPSVSNKTASFGIVSTDIGRMFVFTGTFGQALATATLPASASLFNGWSFEIKSPGMSILRLDPGAGRTVDGSATLDILPGQEGRVIFDGANFITRGIAKRVIVSKQTFAMSAFNVLQLPPGYSRVNVYLDAIQVSTSGQNIIFQIATDGVPNFIATGNYYDTYSYSGSNTASSTTRQSAQLNGIAFVAQGVSAAAKGTMELTFAQGGAVYNSWEIHSNGFDSTGLRIWLWSEAGLCDLNTIRATHIRFFAGSGNISGTYMVEGIV